MLRYQSLFFQGCCQGDKGEEQKEHVGNTDMETLVDNISDLAAKVLEIFGEKSFWKFFILHKNLEKCFIQLTVFFLIQISTSIFTSIISILKYFGENFWKKRSKLN